MIREVREAIAAELADGPWEVHDYKPDDLGPLPAVVVDRPAVNVDVQHHTFTVPVVVIGDRSGSREAQTELDEITYAVSVRLRGPSFAVSRIEPSLSTVAELTYPSYTLTVTCGATECEKS
jgi:hypothetical protein